ncbi:MAG: hypothetical protein QOJ03_619 [Frankiaceae bacterium]|nr:hypothetical protein [Frankiaceae bacterium]
MITAVPQPPVTRDGASAAARRELSKAIYHRYDDPWPVRLFNAIQHWLGHVLDTVGRHAPGGSAGAVALVIGITGLLIAARVKLGPLRREMRLAGALLTDRETSAADYRRRADAAAAGGRWDEAVIDRMRAIARGLEERGIVDPRPGRTADELARDIGVVLPAAAAAVQAAAQTFDAVAYGGRPAGPESYATVVAADALAIDQRRVAAGAPA